MTSLERALARIIELIEQARISCDARALASLERKKLAICAALAAPEQGWS